MSASKVITLGQYGGKPIEWLVLEEDAEGEMLILSRHALAFHCYHGEFAPVEWASCDLWHWLDEVFLAEAFAAQERASICEGEFEGATHKKIFLLSQEGVETFLSEQERKVQFQGELKDGEDFYTDAEGNVIWWLRTVGTRDSSAMAVYTDGRILTGGLPVDYQGAVRPAMVIHR